MRSCCTCHYLIQYGWLRYLSPDPFEEEFSISHNIQGVKFRARATGSLSNVALNLNATLRKASAVVGGTTTLTTDSETV